ncbi:MAG: D-alanyl-D-alanine carboxypeptidase [Solobacterium sp.]|nr:D-alanyl-D-alanine carboxypeptidase [Solobacterium sp.]
MRKLTAAFLAAAAFLMPVHAEPSPSPETEPGEETAGEAEEETEEYALEIASEYAVLIELGSGTVLFEKGADEPGDPASLTKIMTVLIAAEELKDDDALTMSAQAFQTYSHDQGVLWIQQGETLTVKDCEYASMLASANDTCAMLAEGSAGDVSAFVKKMNERAEEIGMTKTHFDNPFGTAAAGQYSTAYDLALLTREAMQNETFAAVFAAPSYTIGATNMQAQKRTIANDCELLRDGDYSYEGAAGGKIGSTSANGFALAACAKRGGTGLAAVVMHEGSAETAYKDISALFDYGFENTHTVTITPEDIGTKTVTVNNGKQHVADVVFSADSSYNILLPKGIDAESISSEIIVQNENSADPGHISARVVFLLDGEEIGSSPLKAEIIREPEKEPVNYVELLRTGFDWLSVLALAAIVLVPLGKYLYLKLMPPK